MTRVPNTGHSAPHGLRGAPVPIITAAAVTLPDPALELGLYPPSAPAANITGADRGLIGLTWPLALFIASLFAWRSAPAAALGALVSSKISQWTLLVARSSSSGQRSGWRSEGLSGPPAPGCARSADPTGYTTRGLCFLVKQCLP